MAVVQIGPVGMMMRHGLVNMRVRMRILSYFSFMRVLVMLVMGMSMVVF